MWLCEKLWPLLKRSVLLCWYCRKSKEALRIKKKTKMALGWNSCLDPRTEDDLKKWPWLIVARLDQHNLTGCPPVGCKEPMRGRCEQPPPDPQPPDAAAASSHWSMEATCVQTLRVRASDRGPARLGVTADDFISRLACSGQMLFLLLKWHKDLGGAKEVVVYPLQSSSYWNVSLA